MRRPKLVHFTAVDSDDYISVRASLSLSSGAKFPLLAQEISDIVPTRPIESLGLLSGQEFSLRILGFTQNGTEVYNKTFDSDSFGDFYFRIHQDQKREPITRLMAYETKLRPGLDLLIGSFIPLKVPTPKKIIITDFDKTLVDTRYHTMRELYRSLRSPLSDFPKIDNSITLVKDYIQQGFIPFIVSASPHFYENAIRDWLYQNQIFSSNIFLKDYRRVFSFFEGELGPKDLKIQGFYKLNHIVNILLMTGIPEELILVGDGFESDTIIYLTLSSMITRRQDPWVLWNMLKQEESFKLSNGQHFKFLSKFYQLNNLCEQTPKAKVKIHIRCREAMLKEWQTKKLNLDLFDQMKADVDFYLG